MPIDPSQVKWDPIDLSRVKWDEPADGKRKLAEETSDVDAALIAAGKTGNDIWESAKQGGLNVGQVMSYLLPGRLKEVAQQELAKLRAAQAKRVAEDHAEVKNLEDAHPVASAIGGAAPLLAAPMVRVAQGGGALASAANAAASGALASGMEYGSPEERLGRAAVGGAAGGAVGGALGAIANKASKPVARVESESLDAAIEAAKRLGIQLTPGQVTGNKALQMAEQRLAKMPGSSGAMQEFQRGNDLALNRAAARAMGETAEEITPDIFGGASKRIGGEFDRLSKGKSVALGQPFNEALVTLQTQQARLGEFADPQVNQLVTKGLDLAKRGSVDGEAYQAIRSSLGRKAQDAFGSGNSELGQALKTVRGAMDEAAEAGMTGADREAWGIARKQWAALKTLEKGNVVEGGKVAPGRVKEALRTARPKDYKEGRLDGELADIASYAETFKPMPDSGTAGNLFVQGILTGINPVAGAASVAMPWAAQKAMFSKTGQRYLVNGREVSLLEKALMDRAARVGSLSLSGGLGE